ncbi:adenosylcobinamide-GDP ribazoletransferase [Azohydromonas lata]|uniref:Adenosylcobinamide-GDP ribazoletransferase n=1 Tax=Azohydromonas lata TaxID=45677 RepID=A0ABU5IIB6_9BURK|nr:adenosylcobinamide-GDP ribazoletransferase [Azohydromonas lata]MDZ5458529.1 adenosylcobinamide-GDP ribazoletransferase [Azohydromonas lata]
MIHRLFHEIRLFLIALQFFTRVPIPQRIGFEPAWLQACSRHFPAVGLVVGAVGAAVLLAASSLWPPAIAAGLSIAATVWLTGGFHEDGLADTCDGLGGAVSRQRALEIMKDSRLGSYGALGLVLVLGLKAAALAALAARSPLVAALALAWGHGASRCAPVLLMRALPYGGDPDHAKAKPLALHIEPTGVAVALGWLLLATLAAAALGGAPAVAALPWALAAMGAVVWWMVRWLRRRLGGFTGDTLGAAQQFSELAALLAWVAVLIGGTHG